MSLELWHRCVELLRDELPSQDYNTWISPLQAEAEGEQLRIYAPNRFVQDWVNQKYLNRLLELLDQQRGGQPLPLVNLQVGSRKTDTAKSAASRPDSLDAQHPPASDQPPGTTARPAPAGDARPAEAGQRKHISHLDKALVFATFVEGKSNQLAYAAARQVADNPGHGYNPLFIYGGVGLGKTHLMEAAGNELIRRNPEAKVLYLTAEQFLQDMVKALQHNTIDEFKRFYRSLDALLIDDIQFFAGKGRTQEEFFHTFNALIERGQQIILTSDKYPKEIEGLEDRLKSRFSWGLTVAVEPPELEARVAILMKKAEQRRVALPHNVAFFIAERIQSNVREMEGALTRVIAQSKIQGVDLTLDLAKDALKDLLAVQERLVSIDNIQRTVAGYYKIKVADLLSVRRSRSVARPRQMAMALSKELTNHSLPEIGQAFGGRDHTTVLHACRKIKELKESDADIREDYNNLQRTLTS